MRRISLHMAAGMLLAVALAIAAPRAAEAASGNLLYNPGLEAANATGTGPAYWSFSSWGTHITATPTYLTNDGHSDTHSVKVAISGAYTDGDAKWMPTPVAVKGGAYYVFSDWYKSNRNSAVSVEYWKAGQSTSDDGTWANLFSGIAPSSGGWAQFSTGFTMPDDAVYAVFVHFIAGVGWLQTDDYSMSEQATPPGFYSPIVSLTFDDGSQGYYDNARPLLNAKGYKTTQYIPTADLTAGDYSFMMTPAEISTVAKEGNEIGSHSVTHPDLTTVSDNQLTTELTASRAALEAIPGVGLGSVTSFAYPFGAYDARVIKALEDNRYTSGRSVEEGYNTKLDLEPYDIRVQNITPAVTMDQFKKWVDYAKAHAYWLVIVYHEVQKDGTPVCQNPGGDPSKPGDPDPCIGPYDTTVSKFTDQLNYIHTAGLDQDVMTVKDALGFVKGPGTAPSGGTVTLTPDAPATNATVTATVAGFTDPDVGDATRLTYSYQWMVDGNAVPGETGATLDLSKAGNGDHGDKVTVLVTAHDPAGNTSAPVGANVVTVADTAPVAGTVSLAPSAPVVGQTLTATPTQFADADGDTLTYSYSWFRNGGPIAGESSHTFKATGNAGDVIRVDVRADDGHGATSAVATTTVTLRAVSPAPTPTPTARPTPTPTPTPRPTVTPPPDRLAPTVVIRSPRARTYTRGRKLTISFSCKDASGKVYWRATLRRGAGKATVLHRHSTKLRLSRAGRYVLRVTAWDAAGNRASRTVRFRVARG